MEDDSGEVRVLEHADPRHQESLQSENIPGEMEGEQTWPTEEEMEEAEGQFKDNSSSSSSSFFEFITIDVFFILH